MLCQGGRLLLVNSDEETRRYGGREGELNRRITRAIANRGHYPRIGQCLSPLLEGGGFHILQQVVLDSIERHYSPGAAGHALAHALREYLIEVGAVSAHEYERWLAELAASAQEGLYGYSTTTFAYLAEA